jgi:hypothetical protein
MQFERRLCQIECRIEEELSRIRVRINDECGIVDGFSLGAHFYLCDDESRGE